MREARIILRIYSEMYNRFS